ncbi:MAG: M13 family metallopeptidase [Thermaurantiacus sp.]
MLKPLLAALLVGCAAPALCGTAAVPTEATRGGPALGTFGVDLSGMDRSVRPGEDFFRFVNGTWEDRTEIPSDRSRWGMFDELRELSLQRTRAILEEAAADTSATGNRAKIGAFYRSLMDEAAIENAGIAPLQPRLAAIAAIQDRQALARHLGEATRRGATTPIGAGVSQDLRNPDQMRAGLGQSGLSLPDRDYYFAPQWEAVRAAHRAHVARMLALAGVDQPEERAARVQALETRIAEQHWTREESRQAERRYNPLPRAQFTTAYPGLDWASFLNATGFDGEAIINVGQPSAVKGISALAASEPLEAWQDYLTYHELRRAATALPRAFRDETFAFYQRTLSGTPEQEERWKQATSLTSAALGEAIGEIYVARHFPPEAKAQMDELVSNIIKAMDVRLAGLEWMAPETRAAARDKLSRFTAKIGYPETWRDYSGLEVVAGDPLGNLERYARFETARQRAKLGRPVDRSEWFMTPMTVNAYANPTWNEIVFPAAILQPPFFDPKADKAVNYGGIGAVIGHEILHHFDDQGRKYDADGKLSDWWTEGDVERFTALTQRLVEQVETYEPLPGKRINGRVSLGENIADLAGLKVAHDAYRMSLGGREAPVIDGFTGDQRFFLGFGQIWRTKMREEAMARQLATGPHSPGNIRPQTVRNHDAWYQAFEVAETDALFLRPEERVRIW